MPAYLSELVEKGPLIKRDDGYHTCYKTNYKAYEQNSHKQEGPEAAGFEWQKT